MKKTYRVKSDKDFQAIFSKGTSVANRKFVVYQLEKNQGHYRVGLSVSKNLVMLLPEIASSEKFDMLSWNCHQIYDIMILLSLLVKVSRNLIIMK